MTHTLSLTAALVFALTAGVAAQTFINFAPTKIVAQRAVWTTDRQASPLTAYYILDEASDRTVTCTRLLYHQNGQFAAQDVPMAFCQ